MIPYKWPLATAIPQSPEVRREIVKAIQTLTGDQDERLRQRRAEIASIRRGLEEIAQDIAKLRSGISALRKYGYNPEEPRVPKHAVGGGEWTRVAANDGPKDASDTSEFPRQPYAEGHHWVPKGIYEKRHFSEGTKAFFDNAKSGPLAEPRVNAYTTEHRDTTVPLINSLTYS